MENNEKHLNTFISTLKPSEMTVLVGYDESMKRYSVDASTFTMNVAMQREIIEGQHVAYFPLTRPRTDVTQKILCSLAEVSPDDVAAGKLDKAEWQEMIKATERMQSCNLLIDEDFHLTPAEILEKCRALKKTNGLELVIVDYLDLMVPFDETERNIDEVFGTLKVLQNMANELHISVLVNVKCGRGDLQDVIKEFFPQNIFTVWLLNRFEYDAPENLLLTAERGKYAYKYIPLKWGYATGRMWEA